MSERAGRAGWPNRRDYGKLPDIRDARRVEPETVLSPRDVLAEALEGETRGSTKVQALADWTALEGVNAQLLILQKQEMPNIGALIEASTEKAAIKETIRRKKVGGDAKEYNEAFGIGKPYGAYIDEQTQNGIRDNEARAKATNRLLKDL
jgi:hypothetical protein